MPRRTRHSLIECSAKLGFVVRDVFVVGRFGPPKALPQRARGRTRNAHSLRRSRGGQARIQTLPWVRHASVRRVLPDTVVVEIVERRPLALWQHEKKFALIDEEGQVILRNDVGAFSQLMVVVGECCVRGIGARANAGNRTGPEEGESGRAGRRTSLERAFRGIDVKLPADDPEARGAGSDTSNATAFSTRFAFSICGSPTG